MDMKSRNSSVPAAPRVAIGPATPGWGSWEWIGEDLTGELSKSLQVETFGWESVPSCDVLLVVKHPLPQDLWPQNTPQPQLVYCPVDHYGSAAEIDADRRWLKQCSRIVVHCERLRKYFTSYAPVEYFDHHVKFVSAPGNTAQLVGPILWTGVRSNLPALVDWVNANRLPRELIVLTNPEQPAGSIDPISFGFRPGNQVRIESWSHKRHVDLLGTVSAALDIKGRDFRQRHKPPAKAIDFIASGIPLAMNKDSSSVEHMAMLGFDVAEPCDFDHWFSMEYRIETERFGAALRELLSQERIGRRFRRLIEEIYQAGSAKHSVTRSSQHSRFGDSHVKTAS